MTAVDYERGHMDTMLLFCVVLLVGIGITMNYSASAVLSSERFNDSYYFLKRSLIFSITGFIALTIASRMPYVVYRKYAYLILLGALVLVGAVFIPGIGKKIGGATRWLNFGLVSFQPSEAAKIAMIVFLAYSLEKKSHLIKTFSVGFVPHIFFMCVVAACILIQRDFGSAAIIALITWVMMFVAGVRLSYLLGMVGGIIPIAIILIVNSPYRQRRIFSFLNPWSDQYGSGFQMIQSFVAFNEGGWFGRGLGQGQQKLFYLPEAHTDFIFSVIGEELGLMGVFFVVFLFGLFCYRGLRISLKAPDLFGRYIALGCTLLIGAEAIFNMGVVMGMLPTKGLTLPFISYGGSSLVMSLLAVGVLLNISTYKRIDRIWG